MKTLSRYNKSAILLIALLSVTIHTFSQTTINFAEDSLLLQDTLRNRTIPIALYIPQDKKNREVVIFSHGYGGNEGGSNKHYSYLTRFLASKGYYVISIQHELPGDSLLPMSGNLRITRRTNWERGVANILFVLRQMQKTDTAPDFSNLTLIGHSNGGDMSVLFAHKYPDLVNKVISLDNKRMPFPRTAKPKMYSLRADDDPADPGVIPLPEAQAEFGMKIVYLKNIRHGEMSDAGKAEQHKVINDYVLDFLKE